MADYNTVPQGQAGTGAAFLLGGSKALQNWIAQDKKNKQVDAYNKQQQGVYAKDLNASYIKNQIKDGTGLSWQNEIHGDISKLNDVASEYMSKGFNVYSPDPRDKNQVLASQQFLEDKRIIEQKINAQKALDAHMKVESKALNADPYSYDPDSVNAYNNFEKNTTAGDFIKNGMALPVPEKLFDYQKNIKANLKPHFTDVTTVDNVNNKEIRTKVADIPAIEKEVTGMFSQPKNKNWLDKQIGGDSNGILKTLDRDEIKKALDNEFKSPTGREIIAILKSAGKVPEYGSPEYGKFLEDATDAQLVAEQKYDKIISRAVQDGMGLVNETTSTTNDFSMANYRMSKKRLAIAQEKLNIAKNKDAGDVPETPISKTFYTAVKDKDGNYKKAFTVDNYVAINPTPIGLSQQNAVYNTLTGKNGRMLANSSLEIVGIGSVPHANGGKQLRVNLTNKDGDDFWLNEKDVPVKTRNDKNYIKAKNKALQALKPSTQTQTTTPPASAPKSTGAGSSKSYSASQEALIKKNIKANPSYSRDEIIKALGL